MNEFNSTSNDQAQAEKIRRQYISRESNKIEQLKRLDDKVKAPGKTVSIILGVIGSLVMGAGMANVMAWNNMSIGLALGIPGMIVAALAYPVCCYITNNRKKKYASQIIKLSEQIVSD